MPPLDSASRTAAPRRAVTRLRTAALRRAAKLPGIAALVAAAGLAGCGAQDAGGGGRVSGDTLTVISLLPLSGLEAPVARELLRGEKLALAQSGGTFGSRQVTMTTLDEGGGNRRRAARDSVRAARLALSDSQAIAVIGSLRFESAATAVPLLNAAGLLHVSPTVSYSGFTEPRLPTEPERWYPSGRRTFHPAADDARQAAVTIDAIQAASGRARPRIVVEREAGPEDVSLADAIVDRAAAESIEVIQDPARADAVVYVGDDPVAARGVAESLASEAPRALVVYGDDITRTGLDRELRGRAARRAVFVSRAPRPGSTPALRRFRRDYVRRFGAAPGPYAALGHAVMESVLHDAIAVAGERAGERDRVTEAYRESSPALPAPSAFRVRGARWMYLPVSPTVGG